MKIRLCLLLLPLAVFPSLAHAVPVKVLVTGPDDKPVAGAKIEYYDYAQRPQTNVYDESFRPVISSAPTGADGTLTLDLPEPPKPKTTEAADEPTDQKAKRPVYVGLARVLSKGMASKSIGLKMGDNPVKLEAGAQAHGLVNGVDGKPAAGITVRLRGVSSSAENADRIYYSRNSFTEETKTAANGEWTLEGLPKEGIAQFEVEAPNIQFAQFKTVLDGPNNEVLPVTLQKGGTIRGRVLDSDGNPLPEIVVRIDRLWDRPAKTDKNGNYSFIGMGVGKHSIQISIDKGDWVSPERPLQVTLVATADELAAPDIKAEKGIVISGRLIEKGTNKPIPNLDLWLSGQSSRQVKSDEQGRFTTRASAGYLFISLSGDRSKYRDPNINRQISNAAPTLDLGDITLEPGFTLDFDVRGEDGKPVEVPQIVVKNQNTSTYAYWNAEKKLTSATGLAPGKYTLTGREGWEVISPGQVELTDAKEAKPFEVRVRKVALPKVTGMVVDDGGKPVANAMISLRVEASEGWIQNKTAITKRDGTWTMTLEETKAKPSFQKIEVPNSVRTGGGEITKDGDNWKSANIVVSRSDAQLRGKIVDATGKPVPGARITWTGAKTTTLTAAGADGSFEFKNVPRSEITLWASNGRQFIVTPGKAGQDIEVKLPEASPAQDLTALREKLWADVGNANFSTLSGYWKIFGRERLLEVALRADGVIKPDGTRNPAKAGKNFETFLTQLAAKEPATAASFAVPLLRQMPLANPGRGVMGIALLAAQSDDADAKVWAEEWFDSQKIRVSLQDARPDAVNYALGVSTVGMLLGKPNAAAYRDLGLTMTDGKFGDNNESVTQAIDWGRVLWLSGKDAFDASIAEWSPLMQAMAVAGAIGSAKTSEDAKALLTRLGEFPNNPTIKANEARKANDDENRWRPGITYALNQGGANAVRVLAEKDPQLALEALKKIAEPYYMQTPAFTIAQAAIAAGKLDIAKTAARFALQDNESGHGNAARMAVLIQEIDPALSKELLDTVSPSASEADDEDSPYNDDWRSDAPYALAIQKTDPATGRLLLEREWARRTANRNGADDNFVYNGQGVIWAMAAYDPARALEWLAQFPDQYGYKARLKADITALAFADEKTRPLMKRNEGSF